MPSSIVRDCGLLYDHLVRYGNSRSVLSIQVNIIYLKTHPGVKQASLGKHVWLVAFSNLSKTVPTIKRCVQVLVSS
jgi:hypothetical protein